MPDVLFYLRCRDSVTDDDFCDVGFLVGGDSQLELDESNTWAIEESGKAYNEEEPDDYLMGKDLVAMSRRGAHDVEVTFRQSSLATLCSFSLCSCKHAWGCKNAKSGNMSERFKRCLKLHVMLALGPR